MSACPSLTKASVRLESNLTSAFCPLVRPSPAGVSIGRATHLLDRSSQPPLNACPHTLMNCYCRRRCRLAHAFRAVISGGQLFRDHCGIEAGEPGEHFLVQPGFAPEHRAIRVRSWDTWSQREVHQQSKIWSFSLQLQPAYSNFVPMLVWNGPPPPPFIVLAWSRPGAPRGCKLSQGCSTPTKAWGRRFGRLVQVEPGISVRSRRRE
jgi:hypothetical protein